MRRWKDGMDVCRRAGELPACTNYPAVRAEDPSGGPGIAHRSHVTSQIFPQIFRNANRTFQFYLVAFPSLCALFEGFLTVRIDMTNLYDQSYSHAYVRAYALTQQERFLRKLMLFYWCWCCFTSMNIGVTRWVQKCRTDTECMNFMGIRLKIIIPEKNPKKTGNWLHPKRNLQEGNPLERSHTFSKWPFT